MISTDWWHGCDALLSFLLVIYCDSFLWCWPLSCRPLPPFSLIKSGLGLEECLFRGVCALKRI